MQEPEHERTVACEHENEGNLLPTLDRARRCHTFQNYVGSRCLAEVFMRLDESRHMVRSVVPRQTVS